MEFGWPVKIQLPAGLAATDSLTLNLIYENVGLTRFDWPVHFDPGWPVSSDR